MAINNISNAIRSAMCDALVDAIDGGAGAGTLKIYTAAFATLLATLTFSDPAFGAAADGVATAAAITSDASADNTGTAAVFRVETSTPATCFEGTVGGPSSGADIEFNSTAFVAGDTVAITALTITMPAS